MDSDWKAGLEDVIAARSAICTIDGGAGRLYYRGYEIGDLAGAVTFEDVTHLLWFGELPTRRGARAFAARLAAARALPRAGARRSSRAAARRASARRAAHRRVAGGRRSIPTRRSQRARRQPPQGVPPDDADPGGGRGLAAPPHRAASR